MGVVVGAESRLGILQEVTVIGREKVELTLDEVGEAAGHAPRLERAVALIVRTWNLFHGRTVPGGPTLELERMVRLVTEDAPGLVGLQEVPAWALEHLEEWSGMRAISAVAMPALGGRLARRLTELDPHRLRSALVGQANALLLGSGLVPVDAPAVVRLNPMALQRKHRVGPRARLEWFRNRRVAQVVALRLGGTALHVVNLHASKGVELARMELDRLARLLPDGRALVLGDLNVAATSLPGFSPPLPGIDQILVRGLELERRPESWPDERRRLGDALLSDHAPVEATLALGSPAR